MPGQSYTTPEIDKPTPRFVHGNSEVEDSGFADEDLLGNQAKLASLKSGGHADDPAPEETANPEDEALDRLLEALAAGGLDPADPPEDLVEALISTFPAKRFATASIMDMGELAGGTGIAPELAALVDLLAAEGRGDQALRVAFYASFPEMIGREIPDWVWRCGAGAATDELYEVGGFQSFDSHTDDSNTGLLVEQAERIRYLASPELAAEHHGMRCNEGGQRFDTEGGFLGRAGAEAGEGEEGRIGETGMRSGYIRQRDLQDDTGPLVAMAQEYMDYTSWQYALSQADFRAGDPPVLHELYRRLAARFPRQSDAGRGLWMRAAQQSASLVRTATLGEIEIAARVRASLRGPFETATGCFSRAGDEALLGALVDVAARRAIQTGAPDPQGVPSRPEDALAWLEALIAAAWSDLQSMASSPLDLASQVWTTALALTGHIDPQMFGEGAYANVLQGMGSLQLIGLECWHLGLDPNRLAYDLGILMRAHQLALANPDTGDRGLPLESADLPGFDLEAGRAALALAPEDLVDVVGTLSWIQAFIALIQLYREAGDTWSPWWSRAWVGAFIQCRFGGVDALPPARDLLVVSAAELPLELVDRAVLPDEIDVDGTPAEQLLARAPILVLVLEHLLDSGHVDRVHEMMLRLLWQDADLFGLSDEEVSWSGEPEEATFEALATSAMARGEQLADERSRETHTYSEDPERWGYTWEEEGVPLAFELQRNLLFQGFLRGGLPTEAAMERVETIVETHGNRRHADLDEETTRRYLESPLVADEEELQAWADAPDRPGGSLDQGSVTNYLDAMCPGASEFLAPGGPVWQCYADYKRFNPALMVRLLERAYETPPTIPEIAALAEEIREADGEQALFEDTGPVNFYMLERMDTVMNAREPEDAVAQLRHRLAEDELRESREYGMRGSREHVEADVQETWQNSRVAPRQYGADELSTAEVSDERRRMLESMAVLRSVERASGRGGFEATGDTLAWMMGLTDERVATTWRMDDLSEAAPEEGGGAIDAAEAALDGFEGHFDELPLEVLLLVSNRGGRWSELRARVLAIAATDLMDRIPRSPRRPVMPSKFLERAGAYLPPQLVGFLPPHLDELGEYQSFTAALEGEQAVESAHASTDLEVGDPGGMAVLEYALGLARRDTYAAGAHLIRFLGNQASGARAALAFAVGVSRSETWPQNHPDENPESELDAARIYLDREEEKRTDMSPRESLNSDHEDVEMALTSTRLRAATDGALPEGVVSALRNVSVLRASSVGGSDALWTALEALQAAMVANDIDADEVDRDERVWDEADDLLEDLDDHILDAYEAQADAPYVHSPYGNPAGHRLMCARANRRARSLRALHSLGDELEDVVSVPYGRDNLRPHPLPAIFFPEREPRQQEPENWHDEGMPLRLYWWREGDTWHLRDLTNPDNTFDDTCDVEPRDGDILPRRIYEELDYVRHFPAGYVRIRHPDGTDHGQRTSGDKTLVDYLGDVALYTGMAALAVATMGSSMPLTVAIVGGLAATAGAAHATADLIERGSHGNLDGGTIVLDVAQIVASLAAMRALQVGTMGRTASAVETMGTRGLAASSGRVAGREGWKLLRIGLSIGSDLTTLLVTGAIISDQLEEIDRSNMTPGQKQAARSALLRQAAITGMMTVISVRSDMADLVSTGRARMSLDPQGRVVVEDPAGRPYDFEANAQRPFDRSSLTQGEFPTGRPRRRTNPAESDAHPDAAPGTRRPTENAPADAGLEARVREDYSERLRRSRGLDDEWSQRWMQRHQHLRDQAVDGNVEPLRRAVAANEIPGVPSDVQISTDAPTSLNTQPRVLNSEDLAFHVDALMQLYYTPRGRQTLLDMQTQSITGICVAHLDLGGQTFFSPTRGNQPGRINVDAGVQTVIGRARGLVHETSHAMEAWQAPKPRDCTVDEFVNWHIGGETRSVAAEFDYLVELGYSSRSISQTTGRNPAIVDQYFRTYYRVLDDVIAHPDVFLRQQAARTEAAASLESWQRARVPSTSTSPDGGAFREGAPRNYQDHYEVMYYRSRNEPLPAELQSRLAGPEQPRGRARQSSPDATSETASPSEASFEPSSPHLAREALEGTTDAVSIRRETTDEAATDALLAGRAQGARTLDEVMATLPQGSGGMTHVRGSELPEALADVWVYRGMNSADASAQCIDEVGALVPGGTAQDFAAATSSTNSATNQLAGFEWTLDPTYAMKCANGDGYLAAVRLGDLSDGVAIVRHPGNNEGGIWLVGEVQPTRMRDLRGNPDADTYELGAARTPELDAEGLARLRARLRDEEGWATPTARTQDLDGSPGLDDASSLFDSQASLTHTVLTEAPDFFRSQFEKSIGRLDPEVAPSRLQAALDRLRAGDDVGALNVLRAG